MINYQNNAKMRGYIIILYILCIRIYAFLEPVLRTRKKNYEENQFDYRSFCAQFQIKFRPEKSR